MSIDNNSHGCCQRDAVRDNETWTRKEQTCQHELRVVTGCDSEKPGTGNCIDMLSEHVSVVFPNPACIRWRW